MPGFFLYFGLYNVAYVQRFNTIIYNKTLHVCNALILLYIIKRCIYATHIMPGNFLYFDLRNVAYVQRFNTIVHNKTLHSCNAYYAWKFFVF